MPKPITIIIAFYNKIDVLRLVFAGLERQTYQHFEVVVADDGSSEEVVKDLQNLKQSYFFPIKHVWHEDRGWQKDAILNKAVVASEGEYLIFMDGDCIPHPKYVEEHVANRAKNQVISGRRVMLTQRISERLTVDKVKAGYLDVRVLFPLLFENVFQKKTTHLIHMIRVSNKTLRRLFVKDKIRNILGCNFSAWKEDILRVNGFDERYIYPGYGEDCDLDDRLRRIGIFPISKKHLITTYHYFHIHQNTMYEPNFRMWEEKKQLHEVFTPYGIVKTERSCTHENRI